MPYVETKVPPLVQELRDQAAVGGAVKVVNVSFIEPYMKSIRRLGEFEGVRFRRIDPDRYKSVARKHPDVPQVDLASASRPSTSAWTTPAWAAAAIAMWSFPTRPGSTTRGNTIRAG